jgi:hypothetical protein
MIARIDGKELTAARLRFAMTHHAVVDLCAYFRLAPTPPKADRLPQPEEERLAAFLAPVDVRLRCDEASRKRFSELRAMYEHHVEALSSFLLMPLPPSIPAEGAPDLWHTSG